MMSFNGSTNNDVNRENGIVVDCQLVLLMSKE